MCKRAHVFGRMHLHMCGNACGRLPQPPPPHHRVAVHRPLVGHHPPLLARFCIQARPAAGVLPLALPGERKVGLCVDAVDLRRGGGGWSGCRSTVLGCVLCSAPVCFEKRHAVALSTLMVIVGRAAYEHAWCAEPAWRSERTTAAALLQGSCRQTGPHMHTAFSRHHCGLTLSTESM